MTSFANKGLAALFLGAAVTEPQLWDKVIETSLGPVKGYKYFNESTLETYFNRSESNIMGFLGIPFAATRTVGNLRSPASRGTRRSMLLPWVIRALARVQPISARTASTSTFAPMLVARMLSSLLCPGVKVLMRLVTMLGAHPELNAEGLRATGHNTSGNYGILDQLEAPKWIKKNIANFGGEPNPVTIAGQSFGSSQVYHAVDSPLFKAYFHGGISESGIRWPRDPMLAGLATSYSNMSAALFHGQNYNPFHNVSIIAEMREKSMEGPSEWFPGPCQWHLDLIDNRSLRRVPIDLQASARRLRPSRDTSPGNTKDESGASPSTSYTLEEYKKYCTLKYGGLSTRYFKLYSAQDNQTLADHAWNAAARDMSNQGAFHQSEIMYPLNARYTNADTFPFTAIDFEIQEQISSY
ncbi:hypothetical protein N7520_007061 [Penicillium odoratum]|uniref:uncharacterized protein n=1 Tax=Penicillium odoratum TaxID=1167516 RepID=UPI0025496AC3|nr:uncharacterized protein N7520_007061 [Penicillium odoratum]KAJ5759905.1 hypothetical protein N7520_007061 [Penicillium odoratum]